MTWNHCLALGIAWAGLIAIGISGFLRAMGRPMPEPSAAPEEEPEEKERTA